jgi:hypothetical protein
MFWGEMGRAYVFENKEKALAERRQRMTHPVLTK